MALDGKIQSLETFPMRVCFVAENAWPVIANKADTAFGGMETQAWAFARSLQESGFCDVSFAVSSPETFESTNVGGIHVCNRRAYFEHLRRSVSRHCLIQYSWPPLTIRQWDNSLLWQIPLLTVSKPFRATDAEQKSVSRFYRALPADVVIAFGVSSLTTTIIEAAQSSGKRTIISCASNYDLRSEYQPGSSYINTYEDVGGVLARGLVAADQVFVQTPWQKELAATNLNLSTELLPNPIDDRWRLWAAQREQLLATLLNQYPQLLNPFVLWTGRTERFHKRPEMAFDVARRLSHHQFVMVLNVTSPEYEAELEEKRPANVLVLKPLPHPQFVALMSRATAFLSTGSRQYEGFPNVFLQAGTLGVPVVSADCDFGILSMSGIGRSFDDSVPRMAEFLNEICTSDRFRLAMTEGVAERTQQLFGSKAVANCLWNLLTDFRSENPKRSHQAETSE